ncbi:MAG: VCBS repeat-containing protein [Deltaproteobacteria bacterium]|nr:VCBS repeat-containing protein [Deltaproteobacteria bacterium]
MRVENGRPAVAVALAVLGAAALGTGAGAAGCSCSGDADGAAIPGTSTSAGGGGSGGSGGATGNAGGAGGAAGGGGSPIGQFCNDDYPCPPGYVCEEGACAVDCGKQARCDGNVCCPEGDACYLGQCTTPGEKCGGPVDTGCAAPPCPPGEQCDPSLGHCMPLPPKVDCTFVPGASFEPTLTWEWTGSKDYPTFKHVIATPAVADLDGDGASDVVVPVFDYAPGSPGEGGILCALSGAGDCQGGPKELWCTSPNDLRVNVVASPAVADLDGDGQPTIVAGAARPGPNWKTYGIYGFDANGNRLPGFGTDQNGQSVDMSVACGAPAIADLDADGMAEVLVGFSVFDALGKLIWHKPGAVGNDGFGPLTVAADLDDDGKLEVVGGNMAYRADGTPFWAPGVEATKYADGWPAVADFDLDGKPELVVVSSSGGQAAIRVFDRQGQIFSPKAGSVPGRGGPPTVADIDGDGTPDIAVAGQNSLTVFRVGPAPDHALSVLWQAQSRDYSSNFTGSSVFDFDGDGSVEVIYADECFARVYDAKGEVRFAVPNTSCTGTEYPVVADVNGDGKAEFVVVANNMLGTPSACAPYVKACIDQFPGYVPNSGVRVYRDAKDNWVATRPIWNEHSYHVTNVCDGRDEVCPPAMNQLGRVPAQEPPSWAFPPASPLNRYRANARLDKVLSAPDLVPHNQHANLSGCPQQLGLRAHATNIGAVGVPAGIQVAFYRLVDPGPTRELLGVAKTTKVLLPGASEPVAVDWSPLPPDARHVPVSFEVVVDDDGTGAGVANECDESNNAGYFDAACAGVPR